MEVDPKEYVDQRVASLRAEVEARLDAADKAVQVAATTLTNRLEHANGLIGQMRDQAAEAALLVRDQAAEFARLSDLSAVSERVSALERARAGEEGHGRGGAPLAQIGMYVVAAVIGAAVSFLAIRLAG